MLFTQNSAIKQHTAIPQTAFVNTDLSRNAAVNSNQSSKNHCPFKCSDIFQFFFFTIEIIFMACGRS